MTRLRIAVDVTPIRSGGECGGARLFVLELLSALAVAPRRHEYRLLTAAHNHDAFASYEAQGMTRHEVDAGVPGQGLREAETDLLFCPMTAPTYAEPGIPTVCVLYDLQHLTYPWFFASEELAHRTGFYRQLAERADHIVCISEFSRISLILHLGVAPERTTVVPIAVHQRLRRFEIDAAWEHLAAHRLSRCRFAFYPANFWPHKNHRMLLLAFGRFVAEHPEADLHLVLTGEPLGEGAAVQAAIDCMGLAARVHVLGFVTDTDMGALWSAASFLVFPSLFEGFGIPLIEAMYFGKPVVCSRAGSLPEIGGAEAIYFDERNPQTLIDAFALVLSGSEEIRQRVARAQARLAAYDAGRVVESYLDVFARVVAPLPAASYRVSQERHDDGSLLTPFEAYAGYLVDRLEQAGAVAENLAARAVEYQATINVSEADRAARLKVIERQGAELGRIPTLEADIAFLTAQMGVIEADRAARLEVIQKQDADMAAAEGGRAADLDRLRTAISLLADHIQTLEADRAPRLEGMERQGPELGGIPALQAEIAFLTQRVRALHSRRGFLARLADRVRRPARDSDLPG